MVQELPYLPETPSQTAGPYVHIGLIPHQAGFDAATRTAARQRNSHLQTAISQFNGNIDPFDLSGNRCLIPSGSMTDFALML